VDHIKLLFFFYWNSLIEINLETGRASYRSIRGSVGKAVESSRLESVSQEAKRVSPGFQKDGVVWLAGVKVVANM